MLCCMKMLLCIVESAAHLKHQSGDEAQMVQERCAMHVASTMPKFPRSVVKLKLQNSSKNVGSLKVLDKYPSPVVHEAA